MCPCPTDLEFSDNGSRLADVASAARVSTATASLALHGDARVAIETRARVEQAAQRLGYKPHPSAVALRTGRSKLIGLIIRNLRNPFFLDLIEAFDDVCSRRGYAVMVGSARYETGHERDLVTALIDRGADGLVLAPLGHSTVAERWAASTGRPAVLINAAQLGEGPLLYHVHVDSVSAVEQAVDHLAELGHRYLGLISAPEGKCADPERVVAFDSCVRRAQLQGRVVRTELDTESVCQNLRPVLRSDKDRPTAFITNSDYIANAVYLAAEESGLTIPDDLSVVGHDDLPTSRLLNPSLTTIATNRRQLGESAAHTLLDAMEGRVTTQSVVLPVKLIIRRSTSVAPTV